MSSQIVALLSFSSIQTYHSRFKRPYQYLIYFCFSASGAGQGSIDHRIEQAMVSCSLSQGLYFDPPRILLLISVHRTRSGNVCVCRTLSSRTWWVLSDRRWRSSGTRFQSWRWIQMWLTTLIFIFHIQDTVNHLSRENEVLRANVAPEVLASLLGNRSILGGIPPDPSGHPALPPPNQH